MPIFSLYKTTNLINGKTYVGVHKETKWPQLDGYLGSGVVFKQAVRKYGKQNFQREILCVADSLEYVGWLESEYVNKEFIEEDTNYNVGGGGENISCHSESSKRKLSETKKGIPLTDHHKSQLKGVKKRLTDEQRKQIGSRTQQQFKGKRRRSSTREKVSLAKQGKLNPMWGKKPHNTGIETPFEQKEYLSTINNQKKRKIQVDGVKYTSLCEASKKLNLHTSTIMNRLKNPNFPDWSYLESAVSKPVTQRITIMGQTFPSIRQAALNLNIHRHTILRWLRDSEKEDCFYEKE